jgi:hypothetical protein
MVVHNDPLLKMRLHLALSPLLHEIARHHLPHRVIIIGSNCAIVGWSACAKNRPVAQCRKKPFRLC